MFWLRSILLVGVLSCVVTSCSSVTVPNKANKKSLSGSLLASKEPIGKISQPNHQKGVTPNSPEEKALLEQAAQLNEQTVKLYQQGYYEKAIPFAKQTVEIRKTVLGENHPDYAQSLNNLALLYKSMGNYTRAEPLYQQALKIT